MMQPPEREARLRAIDGEAIALAASAEQLAGHDAQGTADAQVYATLALERRLTWLGLALAPLGHGGHLPEAQDAPF